MEKPITMKVEELKKNLINYINTSNLPLFILDFILKDIYTEVNYMCQLQYKKDIETYNESLKSLNKENEG